MARKATYNQDKVKELRMSLVQAALDVMSEKKSVDTWSLYKKELILKMAPRVLPQLNAGRDDDERLIPEAIYNGRSINLDGKIQTNISHRKVVRNEEED